MAADKDDVNVSPAGSTRCVSCGDITSFGLLVFCMVEKYFNVGYNILDPCNLLVVILFSMAILSCVGFFKIYFLSNKGF